MSRMIFDLPDADREALERIRINMGARSHAEALRALIHQAEDGLTAKPNNTPAPGSSFSVHVGPIVRKPGAMLKGKKTK